MQIIPLYRYIRPKGGITVSPVRPKCEYTELFRIIADDGCILKYGETVAMCIDTDNSSIWQEIDDPDYKE